jgi:hypothetical protein
MSPVAAGAKLTLRVAVCPGVKIWPDETPLAVYPAPEMVTFDTVTLEFPPLVRSTDRVLLLPTLTLEKLRLALLALSVAAVAGVLCWLVAPLGALAIPVQPEMDTIVKSRSISAARGIAFMAAFRACVALCPAPPNCSIIPSLFIEAIVICGTE